MIRIAPIALGLLAALIVAGRQNASGSELLVNGGFELGALGWTTSSGDYGSLDVVESPVHEGRVSAFVMGWQLQSHSVFQWLQVEPAQEYRFSGWVLLNDRAISEVYLEVSWWASNGSIVGASHSLSSLTGKSDEFRFLDTGTIFSPEAARSARVAAVIRTTGPFQSHLDGFAFEGALPLPAPAPTATAAPSPSSTPSPIATSTPTPTPTPSTQPPQPAPAPTAVPGAGVFPSLVNGGFEQLRDDGTPFGWRKQGGEIGTTTALAAEGARALALTSRTDATKWAYQTVAVSGGRYYEAAVQVMPALGVEAASLRLSWYAAGDGSGTAIENADSLMVPEGGAFQRLSTGPVQAPVDAQSVKIKLMLRPLPSAVATAYFDAATLIQTAAPTESQGGTVASQGRSVSITTEPRVGPAVAPAAGVPDVARAARATPVIPVNVKPVETEGGETAGTRGSSPPAWAIGLAISAAMAALIAAGGYEVWRRRRTAGA